MPSEISEQQHWLCMQIISMRLSVGFAAEGDMKQAREWIGVMIQHTALLYAND